MSDDETVARGATIATPESDVTPRLRMRLRESGLLAALLWPTATLFVLLVVWQLVVVTDIVNPIIVPKATEVVTALIEIVQRDYFWENAAITLKETMIGFIVGVTGAWILGTLIGLSRRFRLAFYPLVVAFQITPRIALAPLLLTWFGFGLTSKIVMAATICFFPVLINVVVGMETVDKDARLLMHSFGASALEEYRKLTLPSSLPIIFAGIKTAITLALIGAIVAEFVGGSEGMGVLIKTFNFQLNIADSFAVIVSLSLIGLVLYGIIELIESKIVFWRGR
jgi:NitT/TauT family transport system permease protein